MLFGTIEKLAPSRPRRSRALVSGIDRLEVRSLLSSVAVIQWAMDPRIVPDPAHGDVPDLPNTPTYVNPPGGYGLTLNASGTKGINPGTTYSWKVTGKGVALYLSGEDPALSLPEGSYKVKLLVGSLSGPRTSATTTTTVTVKDVLIVSIGDSYASGEGNPVVPGFLSPEWAYSPDPAIEQENADAHRSTISGPAEFAFQLQQANPHEAVTFVSVANSGASIKTGILGPMTSIGDSSVQLPAELTELKQIIGGRHIDALTISVGGNDVGFSDQVDNLVENTFTDGLEPSLASIQAELTASFQALPGQYANLEKAVKPLDAGKVIITNYPDITHDQTGNPAAASGPLDTTLISQANAELASKQILAPLDAEVAAVAKEYHWTLADVTAAFNTHGYPSTSTYIRQLGESLEMQGTVDGTFHPNATGEAAIAAQILGAFDGTKSS